METLRLVSNFCMSDSLQAVGMQATDSGKPMAEHAAVPLAISLLTSCNNATEKQKSIGMLAYLQRFHFYLAAVTLRKNKKPVTSQHADGPGRDAARHLYRASFFSLLHAAVLRCMCRRACVSFLKKIVPLTRLTLHNT